MVGRRSGREKSRWRMRKRVRKMRDARRNWGAVVVGLARKRGWFWGRTEKSVEVLGVSRGEWFGRG